MGDLQTEDGDSIRQKVETIPAYLFKDSLVDIQEVVGGADPARLETDPKVIFQFELLEKQAWGESADVSRCVRNVTAFHQTKFQPGQGAMECHC